MNKSALTEEDFSRLASLVTAVRNGPNPRLAQPLADRLAAVPVIYMGIPTHRFVAMNSTVSVTSPSGDGEIKHYRLVFPGEADIGQGRISVLSPLGAALLGRREGESFHYASPGGSHRISVLAVKNLEEALV